MLHWISRYDLNIYVTYCLWLCFQRLFQCFIVCGTITRGMYQWGYVLQQRVPCSFSVQALRSSLQQIVMTTTNVLLRSEYIFKEGFIQRFILKSCVFPKVCKTKEGRNNNRVPSFLHFTRCRRRRMILDMLLASLKFNVPHKIQLQLSIVFYILQF